MAAIVWTATCGAVQAGGVSRHLSRECGEADRTEEEGQEGNDRAQGEARASN